jgi:DNA-binding XRE family transcriptional regulator
MNSRGRKTNTPGFGKAAVAHEMVCPRCNGTGKIMAEEFSIGDRFHLCRQNIGKTQAELAVVLRLSRAQVTNIESNRGRPGLETLVLAADAFGVSIDYLLGRV